MHPKKAGAGIACAIRGISSLDPSPRMERPDLLSFIAQHSTMPAERAQVIASRFRTCTLAKGEPLLRMDQVNDRYLVIVHGWMRACTLDTDGEEVTTSFFGPGEVVFDPDSFFMRTPSRESISALSEVRGYELTFNELNGLFHEFPEFREMGRAILVKALVGAKQRLLARIGTAAEERYAQLIRSRPELFQHAQLKHIATFLGITDTSLSRIRKEFVSR